MLRRWTPAAGGAEPRILAVLLLILALTALLALQAQQAVRTHREAAQATLRDYAAFASWELGRRLEDAVVAPLNLAMTHARIALDITLATGSGPGHDASHLERFRSALLQELEPCRCAAAVHDFFAVDLESGRTERTGRRLPDSFDEWLASELRSQARLIPATGATAPTIARQIRSYRADGSAAAAGPPVSGGIMIRRSGGSMVEAFSVLDVAAHAGSRVLFTVIRDRAGRSRSAYGIVLDVHAYTAGIAQGVVEHAEVLPPSLTRGRSNAEMLVVRVLGLDGAELYRTGPAERTGVVVDTVNSSVAAVVTEVAVRPALAGTLLIGGLPRSRLPLLAAVFLITLVLVAVGIVQLRRQHALTRLRSGFISGVSHELRTPLAQISMFAELLGSERLDDERRQRSIRIINEEAQRLRHLVENVLQFSNAGRTDRQIARVRTDVGALARDVAEGFALLMQSRNTSLRSEVEADLVAPVDPHAIRQVLVNLLDNAMKYGPAGQCVVLTARRKDDSILLSVEDEGPGIDARHRDAVWLPYRRLPRDVDSSVGGSGIGLAVVRDLVHLHGGAAHVEDAPGGGARFVVTLPAEAASVQLTPEHA